MIDREKIDLFVSEVARQFRPERVVLFGSYAHGRPNGDSDVDILVVMSHDGHSALAAAEIRKRVRAGFRMDLIVRSPEEIRQRLDMRDSFITEILEQGETLYDSNHARMG